MQRLPRPIVVLAVLAFAGLYASCSDSSPSAPQTGTVEVELREASFSPSEVVLAPGATVRWVNQGNVAHTITPDGHDEWERAVMSAAGEVFEHTFHEVGTYDYFCEPHQAVGMTGRIRVVEP